MTISLASLISAETKQAIYDIGIEVATSLSLPVTSWSTGDPTRTMYWFLAEVMSSVERIAVRYVASGFLDFAAASEDRYDWLVLLAEQMYGYTATVATHGAAASGVTLTNGGGGLFVFEANDVTFKNSTSGKTYHNTSGGTLASGPGTTLTLDIEADEAGSESNAAAGEIDTVVTSLLGVTCSNAVAVVGSDAETAASIVAGCKAKLAALSPNGPADAYNYVATNATLTGVTGVTKARTYGDTDTGDVTVYLGGPAGAVSGAQVAAATNAIATWATPWCVTPTVSSAAGVSQAVTYELWVYDSITLSQAELEAAIDASLVAWFAERPIGGDIKALAASGMLYREGIRQAIRSACGTHFVDLTITVPSDDVAITEGQIAALGAVTATAIHFEAAPTVVG